MFMADAQQDGVVQWGAVQCSAVQWGPVQCKSVQVFRADAQQDGVVQEEQPDGSLVYVLPQKQLAS